MRVVSNTSPISNLAIISSAVHASPETALIFPAAIFTANGTRAEKLIQSASL
jgi:hypothetical protein